MEFAWEGVYSRGPEGHGRDSWEEGGHLGCAIIESVLRCRV